MAKLKQQPLVNVTATLEVNEAELRALDALVGYGDDAFLKLFYQHLGTVYMKPHEEGLRSLFAGIRETVPKILKRTNEARAVFIKE